MTRVPHAFASALTNRRLTLCMRIQQSSSVVQALDHRQSRAIEGRREAGMLGGTAIMAQCDEFGFKSVS